MSVIEHHRSVPPLKPFPFHSAINHGADETVNVYDTAGASIIAHQKLGYGSRRVLKLLDRKIKMDHTQIRRCTDDVRASVLQT